MKSNDTTEKVEIEFLWKQLSNFLLLTLALELKTWEQKSNLAGHFKGL